MLEICPSFPWQQPQDAICWKSAFSSSSEFLCRKSVHCFLSIGPRKIRSAIPEIWQPIPASQNRRWSLISIRSLSMIEHFSSKWSPWPPLIHTTPILEFCLSFLFCVSKQLISNIGNSSGHPIVPSDPSVFSVGNLHLLPPLNFSLEIRSLLPFHRSSQNPICHPGNLEAYPRISKTMLTPYLDTLFVHDRAILIQIEPLANFDS